MAQWGLLSSAFKWGKWVSWFEISIRLSSNKAKKGPEALRKEPQKVRRLCCPPDVAGSMKGRMTPSQQAAPAGYSYVGGQQSKIDNEATYSIS